MNDTEKISRYSAVSIEFSTKKHYSSKVMTIKTKANQLNLLAEQIGNFIEYWGFKKIHGQIWTHIYLSPTPLSALELIERLKVSKALISLAMKDLIHYRLLVQTAESLDRKNKFYTASPNVFEAIRFVLETRELKMMNQVQTEFGLLKNFPASKDSDIVDEAKLKRLGLMIRGGDSALKNVMKLAAISPQFFLALNSK